MLKTIILDTNVLRSDFLLTSYYFKALFDFKKKTGTKIIIPTIVWQEISALYRKELTTRLHDLNKCMRDFDQLLVNSEGIKEKILDIESRVEEYISYLKNKLGPKLEEIKYNNDFLPELVERSIRRIKPISSKGQEFRDALLWLSILEYLKDHNYEFEVSFITGNIKDFADENKTDLHPDLHAELSSLRPSLKFYNSLSAFIKGIAVKIDFITKKWLEENIDWDKIQNGAERAVSEIEPSYFYEYYYRNNINKNDLYIWDVLWATFSKNIEDFYVYEKENSESYEIQVHLNGEAEIEFENDKEQHFIRNVAFGTTLYIVVSNGNIIEYKDSYPVEESGLDFYI